MIRANIHDRRFSDRPFFRSFGLIVILLAHFYMYGNAGRHFDGMVRTLWFLLGVSSVVSLIIAKGRARTSEDRNTTRFLGALNGFGTFWNVAVLLTTLFTLAFNLTGRLLAEISDKLFTSLAASNVGIFEVSLLLSFVLCAYGLFEARAIHVSEISLESKKELSGRVRVAQLSDLHVSPYMSLAHVSRIVDATIASAPDLIVLTGDVVDGPVGDENEVSQNYLPYAEKLAELAAYGPRLGVWAVPGNHDYFDGLDNTMAFLEKAGIKLMRTEKKDLGDIVLLGADDVDHVNMSGASSSTTRSEKLVASLTKDEKRKFVLFLRHRPVVERTTIGSFDLQLSGHTHGGQLFTLPSSRHRIPGKTKGPIPVGRGSWLYVSNGAGFVGPPMRFLAPAEIAVIDIANRTKDLK